MGMVQVELGISRGEGAPSVSLEATVDTGASFCMAPGSQLREIGLVPTNSYPFELADGNVVVKPICSAMITIEGRSEMSIVVFGEEHEPCLVGVVALETLLLAVDPSRRRLVPTTAILFKSTTDNGNTQNHRGA